MCNQFGSVKNKQSLHFVYTCAPVCILYRKMLSCCLHVVCICFSLAGIFCCARALAALERVVCKFFYTPFFSSLQGGREGKFPPSICFFCCRGGWKDRPTGEGGFWGKKLERWKHTSKSKERRGWGGCVRVSSSLSVWKQLVFTEWLLCCLLRGRTGEEVWLRRSVPPPGG